MKICIKENEFNPSFIPLYGEQKAIEQGYKIVEVPDSFEDCAFEDFDNNGFNVDKYNTRKQKEINFIRLAEIDHELTELNKDFIQELCGAKFGVKTLEDGTIVDVLEEKKARFRNLHNELRVLQGKEPREYKEV